MAKVQSSITTPGSTSDDLFLVPLCSVFRRHLKAEGLKFTPERAQILDSIIQLDRTFEADELLDELRRRGMRVSKATVYRTLKILVDANLVEQVVFDQKQAHYRLTYGRTPRDQMICVETGEVIEFSAPEIIALRNRLCEEHGWSPVGHRLRIYGVSPGASEEESVGGTD